MKYLPSHETHELHAAPSWGESSTRCQGHQLFVNGCARWIYRGCPKIVVPQNDHRLNSRKSCFQLIPTLHFAGGFGPLKSLTTNGETWSSSHFGLGKALKGSSFAPTHSHICILVEIQQIPPNVEKLMATRRVSRQHSRTASSSDPSSFTASSDQGAGWKTMQDLLIQLPTLPATCFCRE